MYKETTKKLINFIAQSTDCYQTINNIKEELNKNGYKELYEGDKWNIKNGDKYYVIRNLSSVIAFQMPQNEYNGLMITASHSDSPSYKVKPDGDLQDAVYMRLNVEGYGGMIASTWIDRPLSVSGRIAVKTEQGIEVKLVKADRDLLLIPSLAIHLNREQKNELNPAKDMIPITGSCENDFMDVIADIAKVKKENIISHDLFLYNRTEASIWGVCEEYFSSTRIDDLQCVYACLKGFLNSKSTNNIKMYCVFDNEEVGSGTKQGAKSTFLSDVIRRINADYDEDKLNRVLPNSFMVSADNGHAIHPNQPEMSDKVNRPIMNGGVVIKHNANQRYTTDSISEAIFKQICERADVPYQIYTNRSDISGGSTLGNIANEKLSLNTIDIGAAQLAMHSLYETAGVRDTKYLIDAIKEFYSTEITAKDNKSYTIK